MEEKSFTFDVSLKNKITRKYEVRFALLENG